MTFSSQAGLASFRPAPLPPALPLLWPRDSGFLHDLLVERGVKDPETGDRFTVRRIDDALQSAVETFNLRNGAKLLSLGSAGRPLVLHEVAALLGVDVRELES